MTAVSDDDLQIHKETGFKLLNVLGLLEWFKVNNLVWVYIGPD
jgi:hypothetical protein